MSNEDKVREIVAEWVNEFVDHLFEEKEHATKRSEKLHASKLQQKQLHSQQHSNQDHQNGVVHSHEENQEKAQHLLDLVHQLNSSIPTNGSSHMPSSLVTSQEFSIPDVPIAVPSTLRTISITKTLQKECPHDKKLPKIMAHFEKRPNVVQLDVLKQRDPVSCGYHAIHNSFTALKACIEHPENPELNKHYLKQLRNSVVYVYRHSRIKQRLVEKINMEGGEKYPWSLQNLSSGVMERPYMNYLLDNFEDFHELGGSSIITPLPDFSHGSLENAVLETKTIKGLQRIFDAFQQNTYYAHAFVVGVTNHWITVVANKYGSKPEDVELIYMDSRNDDLLNKDEEFLAQFVKDYYEAKVKKGLVLTARAWREKTYLTSLKDTQSSLTLLSDCISGKTHFITYCADLPVKTFVSCFETDIGYSLTKDDLVFRLMSWTQESWPCTQLRDIAKKLEECGVEHLPKETRQRLVKMLEYLTKEVDFKTTNIDQIIKLGSVVDYFNSILSVK